jgi:hypothetical protein
MDNLHLSDTPISSYESEYGFMLWVLLGIFVVSIIGASVTSAKWETLKLSKKKFLVAGHILVLISIIATSTIFGVKDHQNWIDSFAKQDELGVSTEKANTIAFQRWANNRYALSLDKTDSQNILGIVDPIKEEYTYYSYKSDYYHYVENMKQPVQTGEALLKIDGEVMDIRLVWDGEEYVLIRAEGGELERR